MLTKSSVLGFELTVNKNSTTKFQWTYKVTTSITKFRFNF